MKSRYITFALLVINSIFSFAQEHNSLKKGIVFPLSDEGKYHVKLGFNAQLWARYSQLNPNTYNYSGDKIDSHADFLIRRSTISLSASLDKFFFFSMFGLSSQTQSESYGIYTNSKPALLMYDLYVSRAFFNRHLYAGYGLNLYHGLSRYASASAVSSLGVDVPLLNDPYAITTEQIARQLGLFIDGMASNLKYRFVLASPFIINASYRPTMGIDKAADIPNTNLKAEGYIAWQFWDKEIKPVPFMTATYLGKKRMLNIGTGFQYHHNACGTLTASGDTLLHNQLSFAADLFMDLPFKNGSALTLYGAWFNYDLGPNYYRSGGLANTFRSTSPSGGGITEPDAGTGTAIATQIGYLLPFKIASKHMIQPYYEGEYRFYDALEDNAMHHNMGINYYVEGQNIKFTLQHNLRPYFNGIKKESNKSQIIFRIQIMM